MIVARIDGGLGNQMFQYAYGLYLSHRNGTRFMLDIDAYQAEPQHGYLLDRFRIEAELVGKDDQRKIPSRYRVCASRKPVWDSLRGAALKTIGCGALVRHKESEFGFHAKHLSVPDDRYLVGYWQSERFFPGLRGTLLDHFSPRQPLTDKSRDVADNIRASRSVAIHVRRGDYVTNPGAAELYASVGIDHYLASLNDFAHNDVAPADLEVFVFSNDMDWCRSNLKLPWKTHWVDHNGCETAHEDMFLMSQAACCIIANSTFSWWAAWLNRRPGRIVYAPPAWFRPGTKDDRNIYCPDWKTVPAPVRAAA